MKLYNGLKAIQRQFSLKSSSEITGNLTKSISAAPLVEIINPSPKDTLLDLGTGSSEITGLLSPYVQKITAIDINPEVVDSGKNLAKSRGVFNVEYIIADAENLPLASESVDIVTCYFSAHHFNNFEKVLSEISRVLKKKGRFVLIDYVAPSEDEHKDFLDKIESLRDPGHVGHKTVDEWGFLIEKYGFRVESVTREEQNLDFNFWLEHAHSPEFINNHLKQIFLTCSENSKNFFRISTFADSISFTLEEFNLVAIKRDSN